jgi:hypothetical protein
MQVRGFFGEGQIIAPSRVVAPGMPANGFVMCPIGLQDVFRVNRNAAEIYRVAYERTLAALRPSVNMYESLIYRVSRN